MRATRAWLSRHKYTLVMAAAVGLTLGLMLAMLRTAP